MKRTATLVIVGNEIRESSEILNPNAFPQGVKNNVWACADKLALIHYSLQLIEREINNDIIKFVNELNTGKAWESFSPDPQRDDLVVIYHSMSFQAGLQSFFISTKSMLDIYAQIVSKLIKPQSSLFGFSKSNFKGTRLVGGTLLNWIERNSPASYSNRNQLIELLINHIDSWISNVVGYRDQIVHHGNINVLREMCVPLLKRPQQIRKDEIIQPVIKDEGDLLEYCNYTLQNIYRMLKETIPLLPDVNFDLISL